MFDNRFLNIAYYGTAVLYMIGFGCLYALFFMAQAGVSNDIQSWLFFAGLGDIITITVISVIGSLIYSLLRGLLTYMKRPKATWDPPTWYIDSTIVSYTTTQE